MSTVTRGRIVKAAGARDAIRIATLPSAVNGARSRRIAREEVSAHGQAAQIVSTARARADAIVAEARALATSVAANAAQEAREQEHAKLAATWLAMHAEREARAEKDLDRTVDLAVILAERLLGAAIEKDPARILALARQSLAEARGARRASIDAHPLDAETLRQNLTLLGLALTSFDIRDDASLTRGSIRIHTDLGTLDGRISSQLERLAAALRDALRA